MKNIIKTTFVNSHNKLRNGWWIAIFIVFVAMTRPIYKPLKLLLDDFGIHANILELLSAALILFVTYLCVRLRKETMGSVGLDIDSNWMQQFGLGLGAGLIMVFGLAATVWLGGGVNFEYNFKLDVSFLLLSFYLFAIGAFFEELLHRGFLFQRLIGGIGFWPAQLMIASLFAVGHLSNPGMEGVSQIIGAVNLFVSSLVFGLAYYKTRSLALPIGLHLGWNWSMGSLLGINVSGHENAGVLISQISDMPSWFTGGEFGLEGSVLAIGVECVALFLLWHWTGTHCSSNASDKIVLKAA
ncbi:CPBP family intramembrane glutamic endopeptidase [Aliiglaciecola litoralis]|uniref:Type II CAAX endopeptidase family protein n=1 Tax=Aliiglaciecola litoralis TaxID=582857 RepID=A0ABP3WS91_9ALTE